MTSALTNWAGNVTFGAARVHRPSSVDELRRLMARGTRAGTRIRALGTGHSFSRIADTTGDLVSVAGLPPTIEVDEAAGTVVVAAGVRYGELAAHLHAAGFALRNLGSLPHISVAGACATGTHGSGDGNGNLATAVRALRLVTAAGDLLHIDRATHGDTFDGTVVALGALGVVTALTLEIVPTFQVAQHVYRDAPFGEVIAHLDEIFASGYSASVFTGWAGGIVDQIWIKHRLAPADAGGAAWTPPARSLGGATLATRPVHPVPGLPADPCTDQLGAPGPWHTRLPHFRLEFTPSAGAELQSEYLIGREHAAGALAALDRIRDRIAPVLQISELRTVAADGLWLSPSYRRDSLAIHFTWIDDASAVTALLPAIEELLAPYAARPHWGKLYTIDPAAVAAAYPRLPDFRRLRAEFDPGGTFGNEMIDALAPLPTA